MKIIENCSSRKVNQMLCITRVAVAFVIVEN